MSEGAPARFPPGFLWGTGEDAYQHEGGNLRNDWAEWTRARGAPHERGANFWELWREDFARAAADGHSAHRIGVEWSRLEPEEGAWDERALERYEAMLRCLKEEHGLTTFLNLWHFTLPLWAARRGGWEDPRTMSAWERFVERCARRLGGLVDHWSTMIDSQIYALAGYALGEIPPAVRSLRRAHGVFRTLVRAHERAYRIIHEVCAARGRASVGQIYFFLDLAARGGLLDGLLRAAADRLFNWRYLDAIARAGTLDWLGVNYFTRATVGLGAGVARLVSLEAPPGRPASDMGWEVCPDGLHRILKAAAARYPGIPLLVSECGVADAEDRLRGRFIREHVAAAHRALAEGVPLRGFFYWSLTDNYEWNEGDRPRFGLYRVDYATCARHRTESAALFAEIARRNGLD